MVNLGDETIDAFQHFNSHQHIGPPPRTPFREFLYNPKTGAVCGRSANSWCK